MIEDDSLPSVSYLRIEQLSYKDTYCYWRHIKEFELKYETKWFCYIFPYWKELETQEEFLSRVIKEAETYWKDNPGSEVRVYSNTYGASFWKNGKRAWITV
jgi:hypothetical protein